MMCGGSLLIALTPTGLGLASTLMLIAARLLQGLSVGGEYGASATYVSEMSGQRYRGFWSGFLYVTLIAGQLSAVVLQVVLQKFLTDAELYAWGWRIPFVIGALFAVVVFWIRRGIHETPAFARANAAAAQRGNVKLIFSTYWRETGIVVVLTAGGGMTFYTYATYMQKLLVNTAGFDKAVAAQIMMYVLATFMCFPPIVGWISDHIGRKVTLVLSFGAGALMAVPVLTALSHATDPLQAYLLCVLPLFALAGYNALSGIIKAELYPAHVRALGVSLPYAMAMAIFGGNAEAAALYLKKIGHESAYFWLVAGVLAVAFVVTLFMRDTQKHSLIEGE
jgi:MHS family alpha-ketoglutarate permease-like MFS transporter